MQKITLPVVSGKTFTNETVTLDGKRFENCKFKSLAVALALLAWLIPIPSAKGHSEHPPQGQGTQAQRQGKAKPGPPTLVVQAISNGKPQETEAGREKNNSPKEAHDWIDKRNAISTFVIAIFTILLFFGVWVQIRTARNSERGWLMAELKWHPSGPNVMEGTLDGKNIKRTESTTVSIRLEFKNEGKSPIWIDDVFGFTEIYSDASEMDDPKNHSWTHFGPIGPLGTGCSGFRGIQLDCPGRRQGDQFISAYVLMKYRDIFAMQRETIMGYVIDSGGSILRQDALRSRNRNT